MSETDPGRPRRSRLGWPGPMSVAGVKPGHTHELPSSLLIIIRAMVGLVVILAAIVAMLTSYVFQQQQYIEGRGEQRDAENERLNQRINDSICDLLDQLPEGGLLDRPRQKYGCGPGIPLSELPDDVRQRYHTPEPTPSSDGTAAAFHFPAFDEESP